MRALRRRLRDRAPTTAAARSCAGWPATTREVNEEWICDKGRCGVPLRAARRPAHHPAGARRATACCARRPGPRRWPPRPTGLNAAARPGGGADRRPADRRGRVRVRQVRPGRPGHQRHRLPGPRRTAARRPTSWPPRVAGAAGPRRHGVTYADAGGGARRPARRLRAGGGVADRLPAAAQGRPQARARGSSRIAPFATRGLEKARRHAAAGRARHRARVAGRARRAASAWTTAGARPPRRCASPGAVDPRRRAAGRRARRADRRACGWPPPPAPGWCGSRAGPASAARSRPARCRPAARRPPGHRPAARATRSPPPGASADLPAPLGRDTGQIVEAAAARRAAALRGRAASSSSTCPTRRAPLAALDAGRLRGLAGVAAQRGHRARGRGASRSPRSPRRPAPSSTGRAGPRPFEAALKPDQMTRRLGACRTPGCSHMLADAHGRRTSACPTSRRTPRARPARRLGRATRAAEPPARPAARCPRPAAGEAVLAGHRLLLDQGRAAGRRRRASPAPGTPAVARLSRRHGRRDRRRRRRPAHRHRTGRLDHPAAADHRDARPGGLAAARTPPGAASRRDAAAPTAAVDRRAATDAEATA